MPEPFFKNTESVKISLKSTDIEILEEYAQRRGLLPEDAAQELLMQALKDIETENYSQLQQSPKGIKYGY